MRRFLILALILAAPYPAFAQRTVFRQRTVYRSRGGGGLALAPVATPYGTAGLGVAASPVGGYGTCGNVGVADVLPEQPVYYQPQQQVAAQEQVCTMAAPQQQVVEEYVPQQQVVVTQAPPVQAPVIQESPVYVQRRAVVGRAPCLGRSFAPQAALLPAGVGYLPQQSFVPGLAVGPRRGRTVFRQRTVYRQRGF